MPRFLAVLLTGLLLAGCGMRPYPLPLDSSIQEHIVQQGYMICPGGVIQVSFVEKDEKHYIVFAGALDVTSGVSRWYALTVGDEGDGYTWEGTATQEGAKVQSGHRTRAGENPEPCKVLKLDSATKTSIQQREERFSTSCSLA